jgi:hypothetical protein
MSFAASKTALGLLIPVSLPALYRTELENNASFVGPMSHSSSMPDRVAVGVIQSKPSTSGTMLVQHVWGHDKGRAYLSQGN